MIPFDFITEWREKAPWRLNEQVEQDLIICRTLIEMYRIEEVRESLCFRGGTALYKLFLPAVRYSEDIDLVQLNEGPIGDTLDLLRGVLDPWLGAPKRKMKGGRVDLIYRMQAENPAVPMRLKIEINSREHFSVLGTELVEFGVDSRWFGGSARIRTYRIEEMLATKLRALYQRRKGRDLFDLWMALGRMEVNRERVVDCFLKYLANEGLRISRAEFEKNMDEKMDQEDFRKDVEPLVIEGVGYEIDEAYQLIHESLISRLPGERWKGHGGKDS